MTVRSIDLQVLLPKIAEANRSHPLQNQQNQTQQQQFSAQFQKQTQIQKQQVQNSDKSHGSKVGEDSQKRNASGGKKNQDNKGEQDNGQQNNPRDPKKGNIFDIKI